MSMSRAVKRILFEAFRRNNMADHIERKKPLEQRWLGLGTYSAYKPAIEADLMGFHNGKRPYPRCMGWLVLTPEGIKAMRKLEKEFKPILDAMENNPRYTQSYAAHFMLAGALVKG